MPALLGASLATSGAVGVASDLTSTPSGRARMLPVHPDLAALFPWGGLRRGSTVSVRGSTSLLLALLAEPTAGDSWAGVVGLPEVGVVAAAELGVAVDRLALVRHPGAELPAVVAALLDGLDVVVTARGRLTDAQARRLSARARHRGAVLLTPDPWPAVDVEVRRAAVRWAGIGEGHGYLARREVTVRSRGRGAAARPARADLQLPGPGGAIAPVPPRTLPGPAAKATSVATSASPRRFRGPGAGTDVVSVAARRSPGSGVALGSVPSRELLESGVAVTPEPANPGPVPDSDDAIAFEPACALLEPDDAVARTLPHPREVSPTHPPSHPHPDRDVHLTPHPIEPKFETCTAPHTEPSSCGAPTGR